VIVIDTNLLVYAHRRRVDEHERAKDAIERASRSGIGWGFALPSVLEFWAVVTHPDAVGRPSTSSEAGRYISSLTAAGARLLSDRVGSAARVLRAASELRVAGARIFDLQIALIARDHGATEIWTHDRGFIRLPGLAVVDPLGGGL
jgi:hypothetical protein